MCCKSPSLKSIRRLKICRNMSGNKSWTGTPVGYAPLASRHIVSKLICMKLDLPSLCGENGRLKPSTVIGNESHLISHLQWVVLKLHFTNLPVAFQDSLLRCWPEEQEMLDLSQAEHLWKQTSGEHQQCTTASVARVVSFCSSLYSMSGTLILQNYTGRARGGNEAAFHHPGEDGEKTPVLLRNIHHRRSRWNTGNGSTFAPAAINP